MRDNSTGPMRDEHFEGSTIFEPDPESNEEPGHTLLASPRGRKTAGFQSS